MLAPAHADVEPLTLYQKTARAPLVVRARALSSSTRRPRLEVLEIFKGSYPSRTLVVVPHLEDNTDPTPWLRREIFRRGEESILFLTPYVDEFGRDEGPETFSVLNADQGKLAIPAEGEGALVDALRRFTTILSSPQHDLQAEALRGLLRERNPYLLEAGLTECRKFHLATDEDADPLIALMPHPRADIRQGALLLAAQIASQDRWADGSAPAGPASAAARLFETVAAAGRADAEESVRRAAVRALEAFGDDAALVLLESIGREDSRQGVRYEAQVAAHNLRERLARPER